MQSIIKPLQATDSFIVEIHNKSFEGRRIVSGESVRSGQPLKLFCEENYEELFGKTPRLNTKKKKRIQPKY